MVFVFRCYKYVHICPLKRRPPQTWSWQNPTSVHRISGVENSNPKAISWVLAIIRSKIKRHVWQSENIKSTLGCLLVDGWTNPFEKYATVKLDHFPRNRGETTTLKPHVIKSPTFLQGSYIRRMAKICHANATQGIGRCVAPKPIEIGRASGRRSTKAPAWLSEFWNTHRNPTINSRISVVVPKLQLNKFVFLQT